LFFFFIFLLDYHWTTLSTTTQEEKRIFREALDAHLENIVSLDTLQERLAAYAQIATQRKDFTTMGLGFGMKLNEFCGMPGIPQLFVLPAYLFTKALQICFTLRSVRLKLT
jgi:hypothetical protein